VRRSLAGVLALGSLAIGAAAAFSAFEHRGSLLGPVGLGGAIVVAVAAWLALGAPIRRRDIGLD
jgi:hypothetical protein